jgi:hypothetical protein
MGFETQRHRGPQRSGGSATQSCQGASKVLSHAVFGFLRHHGSPTSHFPLPTAHCTAAISACKASSISPGCNPGSPPQRGCTPCKGSSQMRSQQRPFNAHVDARNVIVPECDHSRRDSHRKSRTSQNHAPREARCCTHGSHRTRSVRLRAALTGRRLTGGDVTWHFMPG